MCLNRELYWNCQQLVTTSLIIHCGSLQCWWKFNTRSIDINAYLFYVSFAGLGIGLGLERAALGLVTAGLDYNTVLVDQNCRSGWLFSWSNSEHRVADLIVQKLYVSHQLAPMWELFLFHHTVSIHFRRICWLLHWSTICVHSMFKIQQRKINYFRVCFPYDFILFVLCWFIYLAVMIMLIIMAVIVNHNLG